MVIFMCFGQLHTLLLDHQYKGEDVKWILNERTSHSFIKFTSRHLLSQE